MELAKTSVECGVEVVEGDILFVPNPQDPDGGLQLPSEHYMSLLFNIYFLLLPLFSFLFFYFTLNQLLN